MMNPTLIAIASDNIHRETKNAIQRLRNRGARYLETEWCSDPALARNVQLSWTIRAFEENDDLDTVLMVDDDIDFTDREADLVISASNTQSCPVSGIYVNKRGTLCFGPFGSDMWLSGLGFLAIPRYLLFNLKNKSDRFEMDEQIFYEFTRCYARDGEWIGEDRCLCERLGGVDIVPSAIVKHMKLIGIQPSPDAVLHGMALAARER